MIRNDPYPNMDEFKSLAQNANRIPVYREILGDLETPLSALMKIGADGDVFLLESVEGGDRWARYSFIGFDPELVVRSKGHTAEVMRDSKLERIEIEKDPLDVIHKIMADEKPVSLPEVPRFYGGAVGYISYDCIRFFEKLPSVGQDDLGCFDISFMMPRVLLAFDNVRHTIMVIAPVSVRDPAKAEKAYNEATARIEEVIRKLRAPRPELPRADNHKQEIEFISNFTREEYMGIVEKCLEYIRAGDIIQVVPSQRFRGAARINPFNLYRALRHINPSPYLFLLRLGPDVLIGSSPEVMVRIEDGTATVRPIAGTRHRGKDRDEDLRLEKELLNDPKEKAEHVMLVDLGRNDLGRVCQTGTVNVDEYMVIERYSHVMHIVSTVTGRLDSGYDCFDLVRATFPAGTLTGAPKIRAMEIIEEVEPSRRGTYGGCVGYFGYDGNMDMCITIRTALVKDGVVNIQAGGGVVADSDPDFEYQETVNKAKGLLRAVEMAAKGLP